METENNQQESEAQDPSGFDHTKTIVQMNGRLGFDYDASLVGNIKNDGDYADPENDEFIWPEGYIRVNTARWMDTVARGESPDPLVHVESFNGTQVFADVIQFRKSKEEYEADNLMITPIIKSFLESPFCDPAMIDRETERYMLKVDDEVIRYEAFKKTYDPEEQRLFEEWKAEKDNNFVEEPEGYKYKGRLWEMMSEATTEDLFKFKLEIFEQTVVQESDSRELRSGIRKAKSICEVCAEFQKLLDYEMLKEKELKYKNPDKYKTIEGTDL